VPATPSFELKVLYTTRHAFLLQPVVMQVPPVLVLAAELVGSTA
jgi:hypothetical protein